MFNGLKQSMEKNTKILSNLIFSLIRTFKNKMNQKSKSISISNHQHND